MKDRFKGLSRRRYLEILGLGGAVGLAGCTGSNDSEDNNQEDANSDNVENQQGDGMTIWAWNDQALAPTRDEQAETFEDETGTPIEWQYFPFDNYLTKLQSSMAGDNTPDSFALSTVWIPQMADNDAVAELDPSEYPEMIDAARSNSSFQDGLYSVPWYADCRALCINIDKFEEAGLEVPDDHLEAPSWDQFANWVNELSTDDQRGYVMAPDEGFEGMMLSNGGRYLHELDDGGFRTALSDDQVVNTAQYFVEDLNLEENILLNDEDLEQFIAGNAAMTYAGSWELDQLNQADMNYMYLPHPQGPDGDGSRTWSAGVYYSIPQEAPESARQWLEYIMSEDVQKNVVSRVGGFPGRADVYDTDEFQQAIEDDPVREVIAQEMQNAVAFPRTPELSEYLDIVRPAVERIWQGQASPEQAFSEADQQAEMELDSVTQT